MKKNRISFIQGELPLLIQRIEDGAKLFKDRPMRYERAYRYKLWRDAFPRGYDRGNIPSPKQIEGLLGK